LNKKIKIDTFKVIHLIEKQLVTIERCLAARTTRYGNRTETFFINPCAFIYLRLKAWINVELFIDQPL